MQISGIKECCLCRMEAYEAEYYGDLPSKGLHRHHVIYGRGKRNLSEKYGLWVWLCPMHHEFGPAAVHNSASKEGRENDKVLKIVAQSVFERQYSHEKWMEVFGKNYMD